MILDWMIVIAGRSLMIFDRTFMFWDWMLVRLEFVVVMLDRVLLRFDGMLVIWDWALVMLETT